MYFAIGTGFLLPRQYFQKCRAPSSFLIHGTRQALFDPRDGLVSFFNVMLCWSMDDASTNMCFGDVGPSPNFLVSGVL